MTNCLGSVISVDCGEFGYYQGRLISLDAKAKDIVSSFSDEVLKAAHQVDPQVASTSSCSRAGKKERPQKAKGVDQNSTVMHKSKSAVDFKSKEKSRLSKQANSCEARPLAALQNKSTNVESQRKPSSLSSTSEEGQSTEINTPAKQNKRNKLRRSESEYVNSDSLPVSGTPRFRRFEPQVPLPREAVMAKVKNRGKVKGPSGNPLLDSKKLPGKVASGNSDLIKPVDFDLLNTDFDFDANLERFKKEDFDEEYYETVEKQKMSQNFAHYENIINDPTRCISWMNICGSNGTTERADACSKFATGEALSSTPVHLILSSSYETTYDGFPVPVLDAALKKKYLLECCASMGPDVFHYLVADRLIMWLIDVSGRFSISLDDIVVLASPSTPLRLIDRVLFHLDNRGARTNLFGRFTSSEFGLVSTVDRVSALPLAPKVIVMLADDLRADALIWLRKQTTAHVVSLECCPSGVDYRKLHV